MRIGRLVCNYECLKFVVASWSPPLTPHHSAGLVRSCAKIAWQMQLASTSATTMSSYTNAAVAQTCQWWWLSQVCGGSIAANSRKTITLWFDRRSVQFVALLFDILKGLTVLFEGLHLCANKPLHSEVLQLNLSWPQCHLVLGINPRQTWAQPIWWPPGEPHLLNITFFSMATLPFLCLNCHLMLLRHVLERAPCAFTLFHGWRRPQMFIPFHLTITPTRFDSFHKSIHFPPTYALHDPSFRSCAPWASSNVSLFRGTVQVRMMHRNPEAVAGCAANNTFSTGVPWAKCQTVASRRAILGTSSCGPLPNHSDRLGPVPNTIACLHISSCCEETPYLKCGMERMSEAFPRSDQMIQKQRCFANGIGKKEKALGESQSPHMSRSIDQGIACTSKKSSFSSLVQPSAWNQLQPNAACCPLAHLF